MNSLLPRVPEQPWADGLCISSPSLHIMDLDSTPDDTPLYVPGAIAAAASILSASPAPESPIPIPSTLHASFGSPASSQGYPSPQPSFSGLQGSPSVDTDTPSPSASEGRRQSSTSSRDYPVCCLHPGCNAKPFKRRADLDRHYKHRHAPDSQKNAFPCDYQRCSRRREPFYRLDHFRDHLREFHKEDIGKRGSAVDSEWLEDKRVSATWWRCSKCLKRVVIDKHAYECPGCKASLEPKRKEARDNKA